VSLRLVLWPHKDVKKHYLIDQQISDTNAGKQQSLSATDV